MAVVPLSKPQPSDSDKEAEELLKKKKLKEQYLRLFFTPEARSRLSNVKLVKPDLAIAIEDEVIQLGAAGKISHPITDEELKGMLVRVEEPRREFKIRYI
jgi:programmed cell death protein 5